MLNKVQIFDFYAKEIISQFFNMRLKCLMSNGYNTKDILNCDIIDDEVIEKNCEISNRILNVRKKFIIGKMENIKEEYFDE